MAAPRPSELTRVRPAAAADSPWIEGFLGSFGATRVARAGELVAPFDHPMLIATVGDRRVGLLTYIVDGGTCEILTIHAAERWRGVGTRLIAAVDLVAAGAGCSRLWLVTTNDNMEALGFYQRRGFRLRAIRPGAVDEARERLKPEIPTIGDHGIPLRDEIDLERTVGG